MKFGSYLKDNILTIIMNILLMIGLSLFLVSAGNTADTVFLILGCWLLVLSVFYVLKFYFRKRHIERLFGVANELEERYLFGEIIERPEKCDDFAYYQLIKMSCKSMQDKVNLIGREHAEYQEYIEKWIHEIKTPTSAIKLICENNKSDVTRTILAEIAKLNHFAEQTLYFTRSENVEKDYLIRRFVLEDIIHNAIAENKQILMNNHVKIVITNCDKTIYTDEKWIVFIINQLISNAIKYKTENAEIVFKGIKDDFGVELTIKDNGIGISESDLARIFEKGFTGENGRLIKNATGMGLYLVRRLCDKLSVGLSAKTDSLGFSISLTFYKDEFIKLHD